MVVWNHSKHGNSISFESEFSLDMPQLTIEEKIEICRLGEVHTSRETAIIFNRRHRERLTPLNQRTVSKIKKRFRETGNLQRRKRVVNDGTATSRAFLQQVDEFFDTNPRTNLRLASVHLQKNKKTVMKALKHLRFKPYKARFHQKLDPGDAQRRMRFCNQLKEEIRRNPGLERRILWTDESWFKITERFNRQNNR